jgi:hypothetical protein
MDCSHTYELGDLIDQMDERMESALADLHCDRI